MTQKRPFNEEVVNDVSSKHPRQERVGDEIISCNDGFYKEGGSRLPYYDSGDPSIGKNELDIREEKENGTCPEILTETIEHIETDAPRSASLSHWATSSTSDDDEPPEDLVRLPFFPGYFSFDRPTRSVINPDDVYYCLLDYPPRKRVPVGPEHQADIPGLATHGSENSLAASEREIVGNDVLSSEGICIMPSPKSESAAYNCEKVGNGRTECSCPDQGSIRCVRQHITEAREKLSRTVGQDTFMELGFDDMGEVVAEKWSEEEEQLFHEVIYSNPASLGKNFWHALSAVFPSRTKMEIVSYYFNVFMLRKRAEQNRFDPTNIDSDNDEWQVSDDDGLDEEDKDSGVESPVHDDDIQLHQNGLYGNSHVHDDDDENDDDDDLDDDDDDESGDDDNEGFARKPDPNSGFDLAVKKSEDDERENDVQDGSCTSSDSRPPTQGAQSKPDGCQQWHEYIIDSSDAKAWDAYNNMSCPKSNIDFLPTCSMIEEVFGDGDFDSKTKRW